MSAASVRFALALLGCIAWGAERPALAAGVLATYEFHQLSTSGVSLHPTVLVGETVYYVRHPEDGSKPEVRAADAGGSEPRVVDTWDPATNGALQHFSYANGPITAGNAVIQRNGAVVLVLNDAVIKGLRGDLFCTAGRAMVKDTTIGVEPGIYRVGFDGGLQAVFSRERAAQAIGVPPEYVTRFDGFECSRDGTRIAAIVGSFTERPEGLAKNGFYFLTFDGGSVTMMNPDGKPLPIESVPEFGVSGTGKYLAWTTEDRTGAYLAEFGQTGGRKIYSGEGLRGGEPKAPLRFFYAGEKLAVLIGHTGYAALADGTYTFQLVGPGPGRVFGNGTFGLPCTDEFSHGLISFHMQTGRFHQAAILRLNPPVDKRRADAPGISQYSVEPPFISNDSARPSIQKIKVDSQHPLTVVAPLLLTKGIYVDGDTANGPLSDDGDKQPDEAKGDGYWTQNLWVYPAAKGSRVIRYQAENQDPQGRSHGYAMDIGEFNIDANPPPPGPGLVDVVSPPQRGETPGAGPGSGPGTSSTATGTNTGTGSMPGDGSPASTTPDPRLGSGNPLPTGGIPPHIGPPGSSPGGGAGVSPPTALTPIGNPAAPGRSSRPIVEVSRRVVERGRTTVVPIYLRNPLGTANLNLEITYDPAVAVPEGEIVRGNAIPGASLFSANSGERGILRIGFAGSSVVPADGTIAEVTFRAVGEPGTSTELPPSPSTMNDASGLAISPATIGGAVAVVDKRVPGDNDGDGRLTAADALAALEMSVRLRPTDLVLDINADGSVTSLDASLILRAAVGSAR